MATQAFTELQIAATIRARRRALNKLDVRAGAHIKYSREASCKLRKGIVEEVTDECLVIVQGGGQVTPGRIVSIEYPGGAA